LSRRCLLPYAADQSAPLQRGNKPVRHLGNRPAVYVRHREQKTVAADLFHYLAHLRGNLIGRPYQIDGRAPLV
jgi:hypothetical protein